MLNVNGLNFRVYGILVPVIVDVVNSAEFSVGHMFDFVVSSGKVIVKISCIGIVLHVS